MKPLKLLAFMALSVAIWLIESWALTAAIGVSYLTALVVSLSLSIVGTIVLGGRALLNVIIGK